LIENYRKNIFGKQILPDTAEVKAATQEYLDDNNQVGTWLNENIDITNDKKDKIRLTDLHDNYVVITKSKCSVKMFTKAMTYNGFTAVKNSVMVYCGLKFKDGIDPYMLD